MGAGQSSTGPPKTALHILRIAPSSPAARTGLEPFFDFIAGYNGAPLELDDLERVVEAHEGRTLELVVWSSKTRQTRLVPITPSRAWSANSPTTSKPSLLGLSMRVCAPAHALDSVWHVLDVLEGSPGESAGLVPYGDWIVGWSGGALKREQDFYDLIEEHEERPLRVYVYSYDFDTLREVVLVPNRHWGGEGLLGCVFGFGLLHRIPDLPADDPQNVIFRGSGDGGAFSEDGVSPVDRSAPASSSQSESGVFVPADEYGEEEFHFPGQHSHNGYAHQDSQHSHQLHNGYDGQYGHEDDEHHYAQDAQYAGYALDGSLPSGYPAVHEDEDGGDADRTFVLQAPPHLHASSLSHPPPPQSALAERGSPVSALPGSPPVATPAIPRPADALVPNAITPVNAAAPLFYPVDPPSPDPRAHLPPPSDRSSAAATPVTALDPTPRAPPPTALEPPSPDSRAPIPTGPIPAHRLSSPSRRPSFASPSSAQLDSSPSGVADSPAPQLHAPKPLPAHAQRPPTVVPPWSPAHTPRPPGAAAASALRHGATSSTALGHGASSPSALRSGTASPGPTPRAATFTVGARASPPPTFSLGSRASPPTPPPGMMRGPGVGLGARTFSGRGGWGGFATRSSPMGAAGVGAGGGGDLDADGDLESVDGDTTSVDGDTETETETETERSDVE